jgi:hypothetical protein
MYFSEPLTDLRTRLHTDDGRESVEVHFHVDASKWHLVVPKGFSKETLRQMARYLQQQFYLGEDATLDDWLTVIDEADVAKGCTLTLKTVDRIGRR